MVFQANLIKTNSSPAINLSLIGIIVFFLSIFTWALEAPEAIALTASVSGLLMVLIGGVLSRNKPLYEVDKDFLVIDERAIQIREQVYQLKEISQLQFYYDSFYRKSPFGYYKETLALIEYGMKNTISFKIMVRNLMRLFIWLTKNKQIVILVF
jgi:hypothetical protein